MELTEQQEQVYQELHAALLRAKERGLAWGTGSYGVTMDALGVVQPDEWECVCALGAWALGQQLGNNIDCINQLASQELKIEYNEVGAIADGYDGYALISHYLDYAPWWEIGRRLREACPPQEDLE